MTLNLPKDNSSINEAEEEIESSTPTRFSVSLPKMQNDALNQIMKETGLSKNDLLRNAVALFNVAYTGRKKGLNMSLTDENDDVISHIVSTV